MGLLGPSFAPDPTRLEASVIDLLALDHDSDEGCFHDFDSVEAFEAALRRWAGGDQDLLMASLLRDLTADPPFLCEAIARDWSWRDESVQNLHTRLSEAILTSPPVFLRRSAPSAGRVRVGERGVPALPPFPVTSIPNARRWRVISAIRFHSRLPPAESVALPTTFAVARVCEPPRSALEQ